MALSHLEVELHLQTSSQSTRHSLKLGAEQERLMYQRAFCCTHMQNPEQDHILAWPRPVLRGYALPVLLSLPSRGEAGPGMQSMWGGIPSSSKGDPLCLRPYTAGAQEPFWVSSYRLTHMAFTQELGPNLGAGRERSACSALDTHSHSQVLHSGWQWTLVTETTAHCSQTSP